MGDAEREGVIEAIMNSLTDAIARSKGQKDAWMHRNLQQAVVLISGLDEKTAQEILDQEGA